MILYFCFSMVPNALTCPPTLPFCAHEHTYTHLSDASSLIHRDVTPSPSKIATPCMETAHPHFVPENYVNPLLSLSWIHTHKTHTPHTLSISFSLSLSLLLYLYEIFVTFPCITFFSPQTNVMPLYPPPPPNLDRSSLPAFFPHHEHFFFETRHFFFLVINYHHDWLFLGLFEFVFFLSQLLSPFSVARQEDEKRWSKNQPWHSKSLLNTSPVVFILS